MFRKRHPSPGARPGTLLVNHTGPKPIIRVMEYRPESVEEHECGEVEQLRNLLHKDSMSWIDVQGLGNEEMLRSIANVFDLHPLALEDVVNIPQRPKVEEYEKHLLFIARMAVLESVYKVKAEQVSVFLGPRFVLTFQERHGTALDPIRTRLREGKGPMRKSGPDYLAYAIIDAIVDGYYPILESLGEVLESLENQIIRRPRRQLLQRVHRIRRELLAIRREIWPLREAINSLIRDDNPLVSNAVRVYLRDVYDHCVQIIDVIETYRELTSGLMDIYLSSVSNRTNEVMKVLTIIATIFIPLTFLVGVYGMNFEYMPELKVRWAYPVLLMVMLILAVVMLFYFRHRRWIGSEAAQDDVNDSTP